MNTFVLNLIKLPKRGSTRALPDPTKPLKPRSFRGHCPLPRASPLDPTGALKPAPGAHPIRHSARFARYAYMDHLCTRVSMKYCQIGAIKKSFAGTLSATLGIFKQLPSGCLLIPQCDLWPKQCVILWSGVLVTKFGGYWRFPSNLTSGWPWLTPEWSLTPAMRYVLVRGSSYQIW